MKYKPSLTIRTKIIFFFITVSSLTFLLSGGVFVKSYETSLKNDLLSKLTILVDEIIDHRYHRMDTETIRQFLHLDHTNRNDRLIDNLSNLEIHVTEKPVDLSGRSVIFSSKQTPEGTYLTLVSGLELIAQKRRTLILNLLMAFSAVLLLTALAFSYYLYRLFSPMECLVNFCKNFSHDRTIMPACEGSSEISQLKDAIIELLDANGKLIEQERDIFKEAAHEIKTPLAVLKARLSLFNSGEYERDVFVKEANKDIDRITAHLKELLFLKSIERILLGNEEEMDIFTEVEGFSKEFEPLLEKKSLQIFYGNKFTFKVSINKKALQKLLKAIGENIISYAEQGSVIFININPSKRTISFINKIGSDADREMFSSQIGFKIIDHLSEKLKFTFTTSEEDDKFTTTLIFKERPTE